MTIVLAQVALMFISADYILLERCHYLKSGFITRQRSRQHNMFE
ncbi:hypothetical protein [Stenotrophomonas maltophilia]|nr:hypothetical protein [Stenotrophomonas maltophilia]